MPTPLDVESLERLLAATTNTARRQLLTALIRVRQTLPLSQLERAILANNLDEATKLIGLEPVLNALAEVRVLTDEVRNAGWFDGLKGLPAAVLRRSAVALSLGAHAQANPDVLAAIERQSLRRIQAITAETDAAIRETLTRGIQSGAHPRDVARQLRQSIGLTMKQAAGVAAFRDRLGAEGRDPAQVERMVDRFARRQLNTRAETIALTETFTALHQGKRAQWDRLIREGVIQPGTFEQEWVTANDERTCPICLPLDGERAPLGAQFPAGGPPLHPRCVLPGTLITASPRIAAQTEREYRGEVVRISTERGKELTCTPNHPVLTDSGWVAAGALQEGDDLVCHGLGHGVAGVHDDRHDVPPRIEEIAQALREVLQGTSVEVPVSAPDFHGDGEGSEVAVVRANGLLRNSLDAALSEPPFQQVFVGGAVATAGLLPSGLPKSHVEGERFAAHGIMRGPDLSAALGSCHLGPFQALRFALAPARYACAAQTVVDHQPGNSEIGCDSQHRLPTGVAPDNFNDVDLGPCLVVASGASSRDTGFDESTSDRVTTDPDLIRDSLDREAIPIERDRVVNIKTLAWHGHVYNLETEGGWYAANGIITHNCRCITRLTLTGFRKGENPNRFRRPAG